MIAMWDNKSTEEFYKVVMSDKAFLKEFSVVDEDWARLIVLEAYRYKVKSGEYVNYLQILLEMKAELDIEWEVKASIF